MHLADLPPSDDADYLAQFAERLDGSDILARYGVGVSGWVIEWAFELHVSACFVLAIPPRCLLFISHAPWVRIPTCHTTTPHSLLCISGSLGETLDVAGNILYVAREKLALGGFKTTFIVCAALCMFRSWGVRLILVRPICQRSIVKPAI